MVVPLYGADPHKAHAEDLLAEAARHRLHAGRRRERSSRFRSLIGGALVSAGTRIGGSAADE